MMLYTFLCCVQFVVVVFAAYVWFVGLLHFVCIVFVHKTHVLFISCTHAVLLQLFP